jgi:hypothetical protein
MKMNVTPEWAVWKRDEQSYDIRSSNFTHDVVLRMSGDFESDEQARAYAADIAMRLNVTSAAEQINPTKET